MSKNLTKDQLRVLKILSNNNEFMFQQLLQSSDEHTNRIVALHHQTEPVLEDLRNHGININHLGVMKYPEFNENLFEKAIPILVNWLKDHSLSYEVKELIIDGLIEKPISKKYAFDIIIDIYKVADPNYRDKWGYKIGLLTVVGNALLRWTDDEHAEIILNLLRDKRFREDNFLLASISNFKKSGNIKKATTFLMEELVKPNLSNSRLGTIIMTLRKLRAVEARGLIEPFINFPNNYKRTTYLDPKIYGHTTDGEVRSEAKKAIVKFDKL